MHITRFTRKNMFCWVCVVSGAIAASLFMIPPSF